MGDSQIDVAEFQQEYDWRYAFHEAGGRIDDVVRIVAAAEGENDGAEWVCIAELKDGQFCVMAAGCDYTGWDCQAWGAIEYFPTEGTAIAELTPEQHKRLFPAPSS